MKWILLFSILSFSAIAAQPKTAVERLRERLDCVNERIHNLEAAQASGLEMADVILPKPGGINFVRTMTQPEISRYIVAFKREAELISKAISKIYTP